MKSTIDILDKARGANSDYWVSKQVGASQPSVVTNWRKNGHVGAEFVPKLCEMAKVPVTVGLAICAVEGIKNKEKRAQLLETLSFKKARRAVKPSLA